MTIRRIMVAVDDSAPALAAARFAVDLAHELSAELDVVTVTDPGRDPQVILRHVRSLAERSGVPVTISVHSDGKHPFELLLAASAARGVDLVVMGRTGKRGMGRPYVGSQTEHVLEFTEVPVVVVPEHPTVR